MMVLSLHREQYSQGGIPFKQSPNRVSLPYPTREETTSFWLYLKRSKKLILLEKVKKPSYSLYEERGRYPD